MRLLMIGLLAILCSFDIAKSLANTQVKNVGNNLIIEIKYQPIIKSQLLEEEAQQLYEVGRFEEAIQLLQKGITNYANQGDIIGQVIALRNLGHPGDIVGESGEAFFQIIKAIGERFVRVSGEYRLVDLDPFATGRGQGQNFFVYG
ncbi:MAG: hypothetical protein F6K10_36070, partial [Moorea sp. SIO2B7]|nr:hypothetical protein [Moorena sp. SIO2B7]